MLCKVLITNENIDIIDIPDNEIAWIKVVSIEESIIKLLRYLLSNIRLNAFYCNEVTYDFFNIIGNVFQVAIEKFQNKFLLN